jgi:hypothetical protein
MLMTSRRPIGNREDSNPAAAIVGGSNLSLGKSERAPGATGVPIPPPTNSSDYCGCEACQARGESACGVCEDMMQCENSQKWQKNR